MTNVQEALKAAIKALEYVQNVSSFNYDITLRLCKTALAEVEASSTGIINNAIEKCEPVYTCTNHGFVMTDRNFTYAGNGYIEDNNFDHDAALKITGDFATGGLDKYAQMITNHLNTSPISKEWVGLSDQQIREIKNNNPNNLVKATEAKLKQLNTKG